MELRHLRYFVAVAEELNFTRAAKRLHTAQPSVCQQIKQLEESVGVTLLERDTHHVQLTAAGTVFLRVGHELDLAKRPRGRFQNPRRSGRLLVDRACEALSGIDRYSDSGTTHLTA